MDKNSMEFKTAVYEMMNGFLSEEGGLLADPKMVKNEFQEGELCQLSEELYRAKDRLYDKLGVDDDPDIEIMIDNFEKITEQLCYKMYDYGAQFAQDRN